MRARDLLVPATAVALVASATAPASATVDVPDTSVAKMASNSSATVTAESSISANISSSIAYKLKRRANSAAFGSSWSGWAAETNASHTKIWSGYSAHSRIPASNQKLLTGYTVIREAGGWRRLSTNAKQSSVEKSRIHLVGDGDPTLTSARLKSLAYSTSVQLKQQKRSRVSVKVDDSLFPAPTNAVGWKSSYVPSSVAPVRALVVDQSNSYDTSMEAGERFATYLRGYGIKVVGVSRLKTPNKSTLLASSPSAPISSMVKVMLNVSQNDYAEFLHRQAARYAGHSTSWYGASLTVKERLKEDGIPTSGLYVADGSGLSRANRVRPETLSRLLFSAHSRPIMKSYIFAPDALPVSARTGTLYSRFRTWPSSCAASIVRAKTGTLSDTYTLSGVAYGRDGRVRTFSFLINNRTDATSARAALDNAAATVTGCY